MPILFLGKPIGLNVRNVNMTLAEGIKTWDPFQDPIGRSFGNTRGFPTSVIDMLLRINGF